MVPIHKLLITSKLYLINLHNGKRPSIDDKRLSVNNLPLRFCLADLFLESLQVVQVHNKPFGITGARF